MQACLLRDCRAVLHICQVLYYKYYLVKAKISSNVIIIFYSKETICFISI